MEIDFIDTLYMELKNLGQSLIYYRVQLPIINQFFNKIVFL